MIRFRKRCNWFAGAGLILALLLALSLSITPAAAQPGLPQQFYGTITVNGGAATAGTAVAAYVNGVLNASTTVDGSSRYGYSPIFNVTGSTGDTVTFLVGGTQAVQTATFQSGGITLRNLSVVTTTLSVSTSAASSVGSTTATLNGNLANMGGFSSVNVFFQYGTTLSYGSTTPTQAKTATGAFTAALTGLTPNITYYFRAVATGGSTTVYGTGLSFLTNPTVLTVTTSAATSITASGATLNGNLIDLGPNSSVNVYFKYGTTGSMTSSTSMQARTTTGAFSAAVTGLLPNTTYYFQAVAVGATTVYGSSLTFPTGVGTLGVTTVSAGSIAASSAVLNGTLTGLGTNSSVSVYFNYGLTTSYGSTTPWQTMTGLGPFTASISGLSASTTYHFQAVAVGSTTVSGSPASFTTTAGGGGTAPPHQFYGNVYINGVLASSGATVAASVNGVPAASTTTDSSGRYGYTTLFLVPGTAGGVVTFYVNGSLVPQTTTWTSGGMTRLNLYYSSGGGTLTVTCPQSTGTTGVAYSSSVGVSGGTAPYTATITSGSLPTGLTRSNLAISGTPTANGTYPFTVQVTDSASPANTGTQSCSITISVPGVLTITCPTSTGTTSVAYSSSIVTTGGTAPYTCSITSGSLPPGLTRTNCAISGTPTTNGTYPFTVQVTDSALPANTGTQSCSITIGGGGVLTITCPLSNGTIGVAYSSSITVTGGTAPYTCSITGSLPPGLTSTNCAISGTPTTNGSYPFTVQVTDSALPANTGTQSCSINIGNLLIGASDDTAVTVLLPTGYLYLTRFQALVSGNVATLKVKSDRSANAKVAIYADSSGSPGALRNAVNTGTPIVAGWNSISIASTPVIAGTYYWLAINYDTDIKCAVSAYIRGAAPLVILWTSCPYAACTFPGEITIYQVIQNGIVVMAGYP